MVFSESTHKPCVLSRFPKFRPATEAGHAPSSIASGLGDMKLEHRGKGQTNTPHSAGSSSAFFKERKQSIEMYSM